MMFSSIVEFLIVFLFWLFSGFLAYKYGYDDGFEDGREEEGGVE